MDDELLSVDLDFDLRDLLCDGDLDFERDLFLVFLRGDLEGDLVVERFLLLLSLDRLRECLWRGECDLDRDLDLRRLRERDLERLLERLRGDLEYDRLLCLDRDRDLDLLLLLELERDLERREERRSRERLLLRDGERDRECRKSKSGFRTSTSLILRTGVRPEAICSLSGLTIGVLA